MCGIVGFIQLDGPPAGQDSETTRLRRALDRLRHRGPDGEGVFVDGPLAMGMRRLAVIDIEGGWQPVYNEDGSVAVVYNGEIYNYRELRRELTRLGHRFRTNSDTEVLVHAYEEWGDLFPARLNGMFAFSLWDRRRRKLLLARDQLGIKPLYWIRGARYLAWASEIKALLELVPSVRDMDVESVAEFLTFGYVPAPRTMFRGVRKFLPATVAIVTDGGRDGEEVLGSEFARSR